MWNNGTLHPIRGMFVDDTVCPVVPKGSTWARNPVPRIHTDNIGMAFVGGCWGQNGPPGEVGWRDLWQSEAKAAMWIVSGVQTGRSSLVSWQRRLLKLPDALSRHWQGLVKRYHPFVKCKTILHYAEQHMPHSEATLQRRASLKNIILWLTRPAKVRWECNAHANGICCTGR